MSRPKLAALALSSLIAASTFVAMPAGVAVAAVQTPQATSVTRVVQNEKVEQVSSSGIWVVGTKYPSSNGSLSGISGATYNNPGFWPGLCQANKLVDCDKIYPGQKIFVPATPPVVVAPPKAAVATKPAVKAKVPASKPAPVKTVAVTTSGSAANVVSYALAQVGKSYVWAAAGPNAFDCSGLVVAAYARIGIKLPHQSEELLSHGTVVSKANLRPGDIVWPYHGHVMIYIGNGKVVEAANPSQGVITNNMYSFMTARRIV